MIIINLHLDVLFINFLYLSDNNNQTVETASFASASKPTRVNYINSSIQN